MAKSVGKINETQCRLYMLKLSLNAELWTRRFDRNWLRGKESVFLRYLNERINTYGLIG